jgi:hypothetical protein
VKKPSMVRSPRSTICAKYFFNWQGQLLRRLQTE